MFDSEFFKEKTRREYAALEKVKKASYLTKDEIYELMKNHPSTHTFLAKRSEATPEILAKLESIATSLNTLMAICENPLTTTETLKNIWLKNISNCEKLIGTHPNCSPEFYSFEHKRKLKQDPNT